jgi:putative ABC transport system permease protein
MIRLLLSEVRFGRGRAIALGAGMLVTAVAFCLLTASVDVGLARINGVVSGNWRGSYDLLVLPAGSTQTAGGSQHLVQLNYLSAETGGISVDQAAHVANLPGVAVAAPLAVVGYVLETATLPIDISSVAGSSGAAVFTVTSSFTADHGLSRYPTEDDGYVYVTPDPLSPFQLGPGEVGPLEHLPDGRTVTVCPTLFANTFVSSPFQRDAQATQGQNCDSRSGQSAGTIQGTVEWSFPVLVAGIDPVAENELNGIKSAVTSGTYLGEAERPSTVGASLVVPVLGSTASFDGDVDQVTVNRLPASAVDVARSGKAPGVLLRTLEAEPSTPVLHDTITSSQAWQSLLDQLSVAVNPDQTEFAQIVSQSWSAGPVTYRGNASTGLDPAPVTNPVTVWTSGISVNGSGYVPAPPAAEDTGFRLLSEHLAFGGSNSITTLIHAVGEFDPYKLAGFSGAGPGSSLASYRAPLLTGADATTRAELGNQPLQPDGNMAGYAQQPPILLTNLAGVAALENPGAFAGTAEQAAAPIGSIRVRVADLHGSIQQQLQKIAAVGQEIRTATGLHVIVTAGASPEPVTISLPAAVFGRPALQLSEQWTAVMVALVVLQQADRESLALFALILVVCGLFLGEAALAGVRARRREIGVLRALGWGRRQVFVLVLGEVAALGLLAGVVGSAVSVALIEVLKLSLPLWRAVLVLPVAVVLATLSGLVPAWLAARAEPTDAIAPATRAPGRSGFAVRSIAGLAITGLSRVPGRSALAAIGLGVGVAALTVLLAAQASFGSSIGDSELAGLVTATTRGTDVISALLAIGLGAAAVADVTYLNLRERAGELAALAASGWGRREIGTLLGVEGLITAAVGSTAGAALGLVAAATAFGLTLPVFAAAVAAAAGGTIVALAGTAVILAFASDRPLAEVLAADE